MNVRLTVRSVLVSLVFVFVAAFVLLLRFLEVRRRIRRHCPLADPFPTHLGSIACHGQGGPGQG